jgi:hypothetical protein
MAELKRFGPAWVEVDTQRFDDLDDTMSAMEPWTSAASRKRGIAVDSEMVATAVMRGIERNQPVIWVPSTLRWDFLVLRHLPRQVWGWLPV